MGRSQAHETSSWVGMGQSQAQLTQVQSNRLKTKLTCDNSNTDWVELA